MFLKNELASVMRGDVVDDAETPAQMSRDTSLFVRVPQVVAYPKDAEDVSRLVRKVAELKKAGEDVSVTARSAGTDMSGGPLTDSVVAVFTKYMNKVLSVVRDSTGGYAIAEPGAYYRDFEKKTLAQGGLMLESYPASRELAAIGGIVNNNSGGERTLEYGKTEKYIEEVEVVLSDGTLTTLRALRPDELAQKKAQQGLEGDIYRRMDDLLAQNAELIAEHAPKVSKNSAGYALWNIQDAPTGTFNLAKLICGAQGTLALMTKAKLRLVKDQGSRSMLVAFLSEKDMPDLPAIVHAVLPHNPESFESFDKHTLSLAVKFLPSMLRQMGISARRASASLSCRKSGTVLTGGAPYLILMAEFSEDTQEAALAAASAAQKDLAPFMLSTRVLKDARASEKYWIVRRESFALLRKHAKGMYAAPFIDDFVVPPDSYPQFLPGARRALGPVQGILRIHRGRPYRQRQFPHHPAHGPFAPRGAQCRPRARPESVRARPEIRRHDHRRAQRRHHPHAVPPEALRSRDVQALRGNEAHLRPAGHLQPGQEGRRHLRGHQEVHAHDGG